MEIRPFKAFRFNSNVVGDLGLCLAPPYDIIDDTLREKLSRQSPYNIARIIKPQPQTGDTPDNNQHTRAADCLKEWIASGVLKPDEKPTIYAYIQDFSINTQTFRRSAFIALAKLRQFGDRIHPHEKTLNAPKADRLNLMQKTAAQFGQIFMIYDDPQKIADNIIANTAAREPLIDHTDDETKLRHRLFAIDTPDDIVAIVNMMAHNQAVIADGHHRYETALNYYQQTQNPAARYRMTAFVNMQNPGLVVLPTHRLVKNLPDFELKTLLEKLKQNFQITEFPFTDNSQKVPARQQMFDLMKQNFDKARNAFGIYAGTQAFYVAVLENSSALANAAPEISHIARTLDVNILHKLILEKILGVGEKQLADQANLEYVKDIANAVDNAVTQVDNSAAQVVFFMNPTKLEQVKAVAAAGEKMPQKSTFFYPKVYTGLVINKL